MDAAALADSELAAPWQACGLDCFDPEIGFALGRDVHRTLAVAKSQDGAGRELWHLKLPRGRLDIGPDALDRGTDRHQ
jgi:hypothetical protein